VSELSVGEPTIVSAAWRYRLIVLAAVVAFLGASLVYAEARPPTYSATASLALADPHNNGVFANSNNQAADRYVGDQITVLKSPQLATDAANAAAAQNPPLNLSTDDFKSHTTISGVPLTGNLVQITFTASDASTALGAVNAIVTAYEQVVQKSVKAQLAALLGQIDAELSGIDTQLSTLATQLGGASASAQPGLLLQQQALRARRDSLTQKRDQVVVDAASGTNGVSLSLPPQAATHTSKLVASLPIIAVATVLGLIVGIVVAYVLASRRPVFRRRDEPEGVLGAPLIAEIPRFAVEMTRFDRLRPLSAGTTSAAPASAAFRRAALLLQTRPTAAAGRGKPRRAGGHVSEGAARRLIVVSAARLDGRSTVVANLGMALADTGLSVVVVDADPRTGGLTRLLRGYFQSIPVRGRPEHGLASMSLEGLTRPGRSRGRLSLLRVGQIVIGDGQADRDRILDELESDCDAVLIDLPPAGDLGAYLPMVRRAEAALVVVDHDDSIASLEEVARLLGAIEVPPVGYVYNHRPRIGRKASATVRAQRAAAVDREAGLPPGPPPSRPPSAPAQSDGAMLAG
jgi:Mrp family chromosome partitioning ATPase/capsular polysaccharide biosynthesis protein